MLINSPSSTEAAESTMQSLLSAIPDVTDNRITIPFVRDNTVAFNSQKHKFTILGEALKTGHQSWMGGVVTVNHKKSEKGIISKTWYDEPFAYAEISGLSDEAMSIVQSPAYRGVSQESKAIKSDEYGNVSEIKGTGITLVIFPETPACDMKAGCGKLISSMGIETPDYIKFDVAVKNNNRKIIKIRDQSVYMDPSERDDDELFKSRLANDIGYMGLGTYYIFDHDVDIKVGDEMPDIEPIHTVAITVSTIPESNSYINTDKSKLQSMSTTRGTIMDGKPDDSALEALTKENEALKTQSTALSSDLTARDAKIADLESQMVSIKTDAEKEVSTLKSTIEKYTADMPTVIKSALEAHDAANSEKLAYSASVTELKSVMKDEPIAEFLKTEPNTAQIMSMVKALKSANTGEVGVGSGDNHKEDEITSMGEWDPVKKEWI